jgi:hypothetical protein
MASRATRLNPGPLGVSVELPSARFNRLATKVVLALLVCATAAHCAGTVVRSADPWEARPVGAFQTWKRIDTALIRNIPPEHAPRAIRLLATEPVLPVSKKLQVDLPGLACPVGTELYLLRGLCIGCLDSGFTVYERAAEVWVDHFALARRTTPMQRSPVLACLASKPERVYVAASAAQ